jgi:hypothetical protein
VKTLSYEYRSFSVIASQSIIASQPVIDSQSIIGFVPDATATSPVVIGFGAANNLGHLYFYAATH